MSRTYDATRSRTPGGEFENSSGEVYPAAPEQQLPAPVDRPAFAERFRRALPAAVSFTEQARVFVLSEQASTGLTSTGRSGRPGTQLRVVASVVRTD